jgi:hypothetical protein
MTIERSALLWRLLHTRPIYYEGKPVHRRDAERVEKTQRKEEEESIFTSSFLSSLFPLPLSSLFSAIPLLSLRLGGEKHRSIRLFAVVSPCNCPDWYIVKAIR